MAAVNPPESVLFDPGPARCRSLCVITLRTPPRPRRSAEQSPVAHGAKHFVRTTFRVLPNYKELHAYVFQSPGTWRPLQIS